MKRCLAQSLVPIALLVAGCNGKVSRDECTEMLDKYLEMTIAADPTLAGLGPSEAKAARDMKVAIRRGEPGPSVVRCLESPRPNPPRPREHRALSPFRLVQRG